jgi:plasmid stability protein
MAQLVVRNLPDGVKDRLRTRAEKHCRSLEGEVREILTVVAQGRPVADSAPEGIGTQLIEVFRPVAGLLSVPPRSKGRPKPAKFRR